MTIDKTTDGYLAASAAVALHELRTLSDGWDGEGSLAPTDTVIDNAFQLIDLWYRPNVEVTPNNNGTVSFEWPGSHLEVGLTSFSMYNDRCYINGTIELRERESDGTDD
jgi:hypothetical protein